MALNCEARKIYKNKMKNIWIQPAAGDAGLLGAAPLYYSKNSTRKLLNFDSMKNSYLGPKHFLK